MRAARTLLVTAAAIAIGLGGAEAASAQQTPSPSPAPTATATPTTAPTPFASGTVGGAVTMMDIQSNPPNATGALDTPTGADQHNRTDISNMLFNASYTSGYFKLSATVGGYNFPTLGTAINPTFNTFAQDSGGAACANTSCFTALPLAQLTYTSPDQHLTLEAGKLGTLLGTEGAFTYQNVNIQRGLGWALEPVVSRGVHAGYTNGPWSVALEYNDGFYTGTHRAIEYELSWAPSSTSSVTFVGMNPGANTPGNVTAFIANQSEYNLYYTHTAGKWTFSPYVLWLRSPTSAALGYTNNETDYAVSLLGSYAFSSQFSVGFRAEDAENQAATSDTSPNAFLLFGPGSGATTYTVTPTFKIGNGMIRVEWSHVTVRDGLAGALFGPTGTDTSQNRFGFEFGAMH